MDGINQFNAASVAPSVIPAPKRQDAKEGKIEMAHILVPTDDLPTHIGRDSGNVTDASHLLSQAPAASAGVGSKPVGSDFHMSFDPKTARKDAIAQMYRDILGREPDPGIQGWVDSGMSLEQVRAGIQNSPEGRPRAIAQMYRDVLNREPDAAGLKYWSDSGLSLDRVKAEIAHSPEAQNNARFKDAVRGFLGREATKSELDWFHGQQRIPGTTTEGIIANFKDIQRDNAARAAAPSAAPSSSTSDAQVRAFKDFLLSDTIFRFGVNTAIDGKYHDPAIEKATQDFLVAGTKKGLGLEEIKKAAKAYSDRFQAWQHDTSGPRPTPDQFLQKTYHQTAF